MKQGDIKKKKKVLRKNTFKRRFVQEKEIISIIEEENQWQKTQTNHQHQTERLELKAQVKIEINSFISVSYLQNYRLRICEKHSFPPGFTKETFSGFQV